MSPSFDNSGRNRIWRRFRVFGLLSVKVCSWYKTHSNTGILAGVRYIFFWSVPGFQFGPVIMSFEAFSGHKTSWWAPQPGVGRRVSLLTRQTICIMGNRSLITAPRCRSPHNAVCRSSLRELYYTYSPATSFAVFPLRSPSLPSITRRAQGCKQAGCRRRQERRSPPSTLKTKQVYSYHEMLI